MHAVLCEIETGIAGATDPTGLRKLVDRAIMNLRHWPMDAGTARIFGEIAFLLKKRGRVLSHADLSVAAIARHLDLTVLSADKDFDALADMLRVEDWSR